MSRGSRYHRRVVSRGSHAGLRVGAREPGGPFLPLSGRRSPDEGAGFVARVREALVRAGVPEQHYSGHSFRIGAATAAAQAGLPDSTIQALALGAGPALRSCATSGHRGTNSRSRGHAHSGDCVCRGCGSLYWSVLGAQRARFPLCYLPCCLYPCAPRPFLLLGGRAGGSPLPLPFGSGRPPRRDPVAGPALGQRSRVTAGCKWCGPHKLRAAYECRCC